MKTRYFPKYDTNGTKLREFGIAVLYPDSYTTAKKYPCLLTVHGIGERTDGTLSMLTNLIEGFDYNGDGIKEPNSSFVTEDTKKAIDLYDIIVVVPNYPNFFEPDQVNAVMDFVETQFSIIREFMMQGFSLGGGSVVKYATSSLVNANRLAYAVPCAPTYNVVNAAIVGQANLPFHVFVNTNDTNGPTNLSVTKSIVNAINASNPPIKAIYTAFDKTGHGSHSELHVESN